MKTQTINFTKKAIASLPIPTKEENQVVYYDSGSKDGLCLIVSYGGSKTFYAYMKYQGMPKRIKIGKFGHVELETARRKAHTMRERAICGEDPAQERFDELHDMTLKEYYEKVYLPVHSLTHKKQKTQINDNATFRNHLSVFHNRQMRTISRDEVARHHNFLRQTVSSYTANRMLALIRHMYNKAYECGFPKRFENPADGIKMFREISRDRFLRDDELKRLFDALNNEPNDVFKNYVLISLYSGQRRSNVLSLRWSQIDLVNGFIYLSETKNGEPMQVPIIEQLRELLLKIKQNSNSPWVLPSEQSASGHLEEPKRAWKSLLKRADIDNLRLHDLRRTMGSYQAITGASMNVIGRSLGHKSTAATAIYARLSADPVRASMQRATNKMLEFAKK